MIFGEHNYLENPFKRVQFNFAAKQNCSVDERKCKKVFGFREKYMLAWGGEWYYNILVIILQKIFVKNSNVYELIDRRRE